MTSAVITSTTGNPFLDRVYHSATPEEAARIYDEWANSYDADMLPSNQDYVGPLNVANAVLQNIDPHASLTVLDAGCGTGLAGVALITRLKSEESLSSVSVTMDGIDLTPGMLKVAAQTKIYRNLMEGNLNLPLSNIGVADSTYDLIICSGTLTHRHVGPGVLSEFAHATKPNGLIVTTILDDIWESGGYRAEVDKLAKLGAVSVVSDAIADYRRAYKVMARVLVMRRSSAENTFANAN